MKINKFAATAVLAVASLGATYGTAAAAPAAGNTGVSTDVLPGIHYRAGVVDHSVVLTTDSGSLTVAGDRFEIRDDKGKVLVGLPLDYQLAGKDWPIAAKIVGNTATLTPSTNPATATALTKAGLRLPLHQVDATADPNFNQALSNLNGEVGTGVAVGSLIGTAIGAGIGCIGGGLVSGAAGAAVTVGTMAIPAAIGGCLVTGAALGAIGAVAGTIAVGGPVAIVSGLQFVHDLNTPPAPAPAQAAAPAAPAPSPAPAA